MYLIGWCSSPSACKQILSVLPPYMLVCFVCLFGGFVPYR